MLTKSELVVVIDLLPFRDSLEGEGGHSHRQRGRDHQCGDDNQSVSRQYLAVLDEAYGGWNEKQRQVAQDAETGSLKVAVGSLAPDQPAEHQRHANHWPRKRNEGEELPGDGDDSLARQLAAKKHRR